MSDFTQCAARAPVALARGNPLGSQPQCKVATTLFRPLDCGGLCFQGQSLEPTKQGIAGCGYPLLGLFEVGGNGRFGTLVNPGFPFKAHLPAFPLPLFSLGKGNVIAKQGTPSARKFCWLGDHNTARKNGEGVTSRGAKPPARRDDPRNQGLETGLTKNPLPDKILDGKQICDARAFGYRESRRFPGRSGRLPTRRRAVAPL